MSKTAKNLIVILGIITVVFAAYYFLTQEAAFVLRSEEANVELRELLQAADTFTARQQVLGTITLDDSVFTSDVFANVRDFSTPPDEFGVGRRDPFLPVLGVMPLRETADEEGESPVDESVESSSE